MRQTYLMGLMAVMLSGPASAQDKQPFGDNENTRETCLRAINARETIRDKLSIVFRDAHVALNAEKPREALELVKLIDELDRLRDENVETLNAIRAYCNESVQ